MARHLHVPASLAFEHVERMIAATDTLKGPVCDAVERWTETESCLDWITIERGRLIEAEVSGPLSPRKERTVFERDCHWCGLVIDAGAKLINLRAVRAVIHPDCLTSLLWYRPEGDA